MIDPNLENVSRAYKIDESVKWLMENYRHIWWHPGLNRHEKAGFLAACCNPTRCYLMTLDLESRIAAIKSALPSDHP